MSSLDLWPIGNGQVSALIDEEGAFVWACVPRVDADPVFCSLLRGDDCETGTWGIRLEGQTSARQEYLRNTAILRTTLESEDGSAIEIIDFAPRFRRSGRMYRPVAFLRILRPLAGSPRIAINLSPMHDYGSEVGDTTSGTNHIRFLLGDQTLRLSTTAPIGYVLEKRSFRLEGPLHFFLGPDEPFSGNIGHEVDAMLKATDHYWRHWVRGLATPMDWQDAVIRAAITLKICQHEETGAIVAALTTSIPEAPHSERNWDYRYCWIRDAYYTVQALNAIGALDVLEKYLAYLRNIIHTVGGTDDEGRIQPLYSVMGEPQLVERKAPNLAGYRGMGPVRIGNAAYEQVQHDVYGQIVLPSVQAFFDRRLYRMADLADFDSLERIGELAYQFHDQPDAGLWEFRTRREVHTYSMLMSWAACDRLAKVALQLHLSERARFWGDRAGEIRERIERDTWNEEGGHYASTIGGSHLDASLLQMIDLKFLTQADDRFQRTFTAIERGLRRGDHMLRYDAEDDFGLPETAFNICTFWLIEALHVANREDEARALFEKMLSHRTPSGLLSEDLDFATGELWGNYPQTYSLVGIINCANMLSKPWSTIR